MPQPTLYSHNTFGMLGHSLRSQRGAFLLELAIVLPIFIVIILGCFEMARYVRVHQLTNKLSYEMANAILRTCVNQYDTESPAIFKELQNSRKNQCYPIVFMRYYALLKSSLPTNIQFHVNSVMVTRGSTGSTDTCVGLTSASPSFSLYTTANGGLSVGSCLKSFKGSLTDYLPALNRPANLKFIDLANEDGLEEYTSLFSDVAVWAEFSVEYTPVFQRVLLPYTGFSMGEGAGASFKPMNHITSTATMF